ncbi:hypothetical protein DOTSEDRAFT_35092 [Dothistroma septosporum NZE10]|uniref:Uncharacterized protein n=1 Tax=Dothistroma septosporum (strain NZE10 / CBS 128990) TaxID=675120 RepID=N1PMU1_DOTSN|nr:hypothetical protein DOTSEDRAFT_35092 [Dothistroma septosporum NZE10]
MYDQSATGVLVDKKELPVPDYGHTPKHVATRDDHDGNVIPIWLAMQDLVKKGETIAIASVSNSSIQELEELLPSSSDIPVSCKQICSCVFRCSIQSGVSMEYLRRRSCGGPHAKQRLPASESVGRQVCCPRTSSSDMSSSCIDIDNVGARASTHIL